MVSAVHRSELERPPRLTVDSTARKAWLCPLRHFFDQKTRRSRTLASWSPSLTLGPCLGGAASGVRKSSSYVVTGFGLPTRDSSLTRCFYWRAWKGSNLQPTDSKSGALSVELQAPRRAAADQPIGNGPNSRASLTDRPSTSRDWVPAPLPNRPPAPRTVPRATPPIDGAVVRLLVPIAGRV